MKNISIFAITCSLSLFASAKVITVNNNTNSPGQYISLQQAIDSASAGDTIYVHGSATSYGSVNVKKRLNFFGTGHKPNKSNTLVSEIGNITLDSTITVSGASGTRISGFKLSVILGYNGAGGTKNISVNRNYFTSGNTKISVTGQGWVIQNNVIEDLFVNVNNNANTIIRNNIFYKSYILSSSQPTLVVINNVFLGNAYSTSLENVSNALIANNIFSGPTPNGTNVSNNTFSNNITYQTSNNTIPSGTNTGSGNLVAQNPLFTNVPTNFFSYSYDYTLTATSPGKNTGTDGTDIGIYGGVAPFVDMTGTPAIPQVKNLTILNPVISVGDTLQIILKAKKQN
ncbi:MAG: hypothetical protein EPN85_08790 [Bacteroidetes bacterium]|nr:MAG: hypothetical protein EPN85_08790 [Bacteroidota bacterium]